MDKFVNNRRVCILIHVNWTQPCKEIYFFSLFYRLYFGGHYCLFLRMINNVLFLVMFYIYFLYIQGLRLLAQKITNIDILWLIEPNKVIALHLHAS
jgi:hypothetical protein